MIEVYQTQRTIAKARLPMEAESRAKSIVEQLGGVWRGGRGECRCPAHNDGSPSLSVRLGDTAILFHCFAGCTSIEIMKTLQRMKLHDRRPLEMPEAKTKRDMGALAQRLWKASKSVAGSRVIVYGDRGRAAERLLDKARDHLTTNGRELVSRVPEHHDDWNDAWRARNGSTS